MEETEGEKEGFQEVQRKRRYGKEPVSKPRNHKPALVECQNMFSILLEEEGEIEIEGNEEIDKEYTKETKGKELIQANTEKSGTEENVDTEKTQNEIDLQKENGNDEEQVMKKLLQD